MSLHCPNKPVVHPPDKSQMINCCYWVGTPTVPEHYRIRKEKQQAIKLREDDGWEMENHLNMVVSTERRTACHQLIQNGTHTPQICLNSSITSPSHYMPCQRLNIEHFPTLHLNSRQQKQNPHKDSTKGNTLASYFCDCNISGAMYNGDPHRVSAIPCGCSNLSTEPVTPTSKYCMMPKTSQVISKSTRMLRGSPRQMTVTLPLMHVSLIPTGPTPSVER
jgi:hypothetical protein